GGPGADRLTGNVSDDLLIGGDGNDRFFGGAGNDELLGLAGDDTFVGQLGSDRYRGGDGRDTADYSAETGPVAVTVGGQQDDGPVAELLKDDVVDVDVVIGGSGPDRLSTGGRALELLGGAGKDTLNGPGILRGEAGEDTLRGSSARDELDGGTEDDDLRASGGNDLLDGGPGTDLLDGGLGADDIKGGDGTDTADWSTRTNPVYLDINPAANSGEGNRGNFTGADCNGSRCDRIQLDIERIVGGSAADELHGNTARNTLVGHAGGDILSGGGGVDRFETGDGPGRNTVSDQDHSSGVGDGDGGDVVIGGDGEDFVSSSGGDDRYELGAARDEIQDSAIGDLVIDTGDGPDKVSVGGGDHTIDLGDGDDWYQASNVATGTFRLTGDAGPGADTVITNGDMSADVTLGEGDDEFDGSLGAVAGDEVDGQNGNDVLNLGAGDDVGIDTDGINTLQGHNGDDDLTAGPGLDGIHGGPGDDTIADAGSDGLAANGKPAAQSITGDADDDTITVTGPTGAVEVDTVSGDGGKDTITTAGGPQSVAGGDDDDTIATGAGNDSANGGNGNDTLLTGEGDDTVIGGEGTNVLDGGAGSDSIRGGSGKDTVTYALRAAPVVVHQGSDGNRYDDGNAVDESAADPTRRDYVDGTVDTIVGTPFADNIALTEGSATQKGLVQGGGGGDTLVTTDAGATLEGGDGADTLYGTTGAEILDGGPGNDLLVGGPGADVERGQAGNDRFDQGTAADGGDTLSGGPDTDVADYSARTGPIRVTAGTGGADDGAPGEGDDVDATVEQGRTPGTSTPTPTIALALSGTTIPIGATSTATVSVTGVGSTGTPTGTVDLFDGSQRVAAGTLDSSGKAVIPFRLTSSGTNHPLKATFQGDSRYRSVTSAIQAVTVNKTATTLALDVVESPIKVGTTGAVTFSIAAQGSGYQPSGTVVIKEGATTLASPTTSKEGAPVDLPPLPVGAHSLTAMWAGDGGTEPVTSAPVLLLVTTDGRVPAPTVAVSTTPAAPVAGASTQVKVAVTHASGVTGARPPAGTVTVTATGTTPARPVVTLGTATLASGTATLTVPAGLATGQWRLDAAYSGSPTTPTATGTKTVTVAGAASRVTVASSKVPAPVDETVALTATVARTSGTGALGTGTVVFLDGTVEIGRRPLGPDGTATLSRAFTVGQHSITARFETGDLLAPSTSAVFVQDIVPGGGVPAVPTTTTVQRTGATVVATVAVASGQSAATGKVVFTVDGSARPALDLAAGKATLPLAGLTVGNHTVSAAYQGSDTHATSTSAPLTVTIVASTPPGSPGTPTVKAATATSVTLTWTAPASPGSSPITGYRV
ncbi:MAG TPA: Ig-like domain repeat protein, partial [Iamia sp.]|nr:Ig-like domain repeat protein [Iamia sp.]